MIKPLGAKFVKSATSVGQCPVTTLPEYAFIGRSNVGKSSLINMLTGQKGLAKTSQVPGKTQLINHYIVKDTWYLVDLPGYGYAKVPLSEKAKWEKMIWDYLLKRENLQCVFVLIDIRHEPQKIDIEFVNSLGKEGVPLKLIFTKADKMGKVSGQQNINKFCLALQETWAILPEYYITSSEFKQGREELLGLIAEINSIS